MYNLFLFTERGDLVFRLVWDSNVCLFLDLVPRRRIAVDLDCLGKELGCEVETAQYLVDSTWISTLWLSEFPEEGVFHIFGRKVVQNIWYKLFLLLFQTDNKNKHLGTKSWSW